MFAAAIILSPVLFFLLVATIFMRNESADDRRMARAKRNLQAKRDAKAAQQYAIDNPRNSRMPSRY